jgi:hypothetical protein
MERVREADTILENARLLVQEHRNAIDLDDYNVAMGLLTL